VAEDGLDAIGKLRAGLPDFIITDLKMPRMSGVEFLDVVHKRLPQIPVIVISGLPPEEMPDGVAADAYYCKNASGFEQLLETMSALPGKPPLRTTPSNVDHKPVEARCDNHGNYVVGCDDCLREFSVPRAPHMGQNEKRAICIHCAKVVQFLAAD
jgi:CheY-like chemotaxis protein